MKYRNLLTIVLIIALSTSCKPQNKRELIDHGTKTLSIYAIYPNAPNQITRSITQDRMGDVWLATFSGVFKYDGESFTNMTADVSSARFFSALEDSKGQLWFGSIGSGIYLYDGTFFQNITTDDGLLNNEVTCIYEDKNGHHWFGVNGGISRYDGKSFRNYLLDRDSIKEDITGKIIPDLQRPMNEINSIIEDKTGQFWFGTRGHTFVFDGIAFKTVTHEGSPFMNVRWIIKDRNDHIWLGGNDGLWRYDGSTFFNLTKDFVGYIYEDKMGNIWTSSQDSEYGRWILTRYDVKSLYAAQPEVTVIKSKYDNNKGMIFGLHEAGDGSIWFGGLDGVYRYDGKTVTDFKR